MSMKERFCWVCGESLGVIQSCHYDRLDTCGKRECHREYRQAQAEERERERQDLDDRMGW